MENYKNIYKISFGFLALVLFIIIFNNYKIKPSKNEVIILKKKLNSSLIIKNEYDIIKLQNQIADYIAHSSNGTGEIDLSHIMLSKKGSCFHRSLILQKILLYNKILIRPVYLYYNPNPNKSHTEILEIFGNVNSHSIFEFYFRGKWYVMETNTKMNRFENIDQYLINQKILPHKLRYIRYVNNRNGRFIAPSYIPDVYGNFF